MLDPKQELVLIMGKLNTHISVLASTIEGQHLRVSTVTVLNAHGHALISLLMQQKLLLLSSTMQLSCQATSLGGSGPESSQSVVDYAIASLIAAPWVTSDAVGNAMPMLSNHCLLILSLAIPDPLAT